MFLIETRFWVVISVHLGVALTGNPQSTLRVIFPSEYARASSNPFFSLLKNLFIELLALVNGKIL